MSVVKYSTGEQDFRWRPPKLLYIGQLSNSNATLYTAPTAPSGSDYVRSLPKTVIENIMICNCDNAQQTVTLYLVETGGSAADNRAILKTHTIPSTDHDRLDGPFVLEAGGTLQGLSGAANKITLAVYGYEGV